MKNGMRVLYYNYCTCIEFSLPRLVYNHNGHLIQDQNDIDQGFKKMWKLLKDDLDFEDLYGIKFTRIDLCAHFPYSVDKLTRLFLYRLPKGSTKGILKKQPKYKSYSRFEYSKMALKIYDKPNQIKSLTWLRSSKIEFQINNLKLSKYFSPQSLKRMPLDFNECWDVYRDILASYEITKIKTNKRKTKVDHVFDAIRKANPKFKQKKLNVVLNSHSSHVRRTVKGKVAEQISREIGLCPQDLINNMSLEPALKVSLPKGKLFAKVSRLRFE